MCTNEVFIGRDIGVEVECGAELRYTWLYIVQCTESNERCYIHNTSVDSFSNNPMQLVWSCSWVTNSLCRAHILPLAGREREKQEAKTDTFRTWTQTQPPTQTQTHKKTPTWDWIMPGVSLRESSYHRTLPTPLPLLIAFSSYSYAFCFVFWNHVSGFSEWDKNEKGFIQLRLES